MMKKIVCALSVIGLTVAIHGAEQDIKPVSATGLAYVKDGRVGAAVQLTEKSRLSYPETVFSATGGTVEMWIRPAGKAVAGKQNFLVSNGTNNPAWFFWGYDANAYNFLSRDRKDAKSFNHYSSIRVPQVFPEKTWTHVALVWCSIRPGECLVQFYVNGKSVIDKYDQSLAVNGGGPVAIGWNTAGAGAPCFVGDVDELRISNIPLSPKEIAADYAAGLEGKPLAVTEATLLYADFEEKAVGTGKAALLPLEKLAEKGDALIDTLVGE